MLWQVALEAQDCNITSKANDILPDKLCAPVSLTWEVTYRGVNDAGTPVQIQVNWDDGNPVEIQTATNTNPSLGEWKVIFSHVYPIGGNQCNYRPEAMLIVNGVVCTSSIQVQNVTVWDTDNYNGGVLQIDPQVFPICVGNEDGTVFNDVSIWNCTPAGGENDNINGRTRWTQWVYGTNYTINNVTVGGTVQTYPYWDAVVEATEYVDAPQPPNNVSEFCNSPATAQVGQFFEVTLRNWNFCNPYDDPSLPGPPADLINGDFPPIETTAMILIVDTPQTQITPVGPFCANDPQIWLNGTPAGGVWSGDGVNASGRFRPWEAGSCIHTICYTTTDPIYGCDGTACIQIEVFAIPDINILPGPNAEVCPGDVLFIDGNPTLGDGAIISHLWTGDTSPLNFTNIQAPSFTTNTQGLYSLTYAVSDANGCTATDVIAVSVNPVTANIIPDPAEVCVGEDLIINGNPTGGTGNYISHVWTGDVTYLDVSNTQSVTFNASTIGTYHLNYHVTDDNGCSGSDDIDINVFEIPTADAGLNDSVCGLNLSLSAQPSIGIGTWSQLSGAGSIIFNDLHDPNSSVIADQYGVYQLIWTETYGPSCSDKDTVSIRFTEQPIANAGPDGGVCGYHYQLDAQPTVGVGWWTVLSGAGNLNLSDAANPNATATSDVYGDYLLIWHEDNGYGCSDEDTVVVSFNLVPSPSFNPVNPDGCTPFTVQFNNTSTGGTEYYWNFGNGNTTTNENPSQTFYNSSNGDLTYNVTLIVNNPGCGDTIIQTVTVHPLPNAQFTDNSVPQCSPSTVTFTNQSIGSALHLWNYDDGSPIDTGNVVVHTFINDTVFIVNYAVELIAVTTFGCTDTATRFVTVYPNPDYDVIANPDSSCHPATVQFTTAPSGQSYHWDFGNGIQSIGTYQAESMYDNFTDTSVTFEIHLVVTSYFGCIDSAQTQIVVHPTPNVDFNLPVLSACAPFEASLVNLSSGVSQYTWNFGDGTSDTSSSDTIVHVFHNTTNNPVTYYVVLEGVNNFGCVSQMEKTLLVYPEMHVDFTADTVGCHPLTSQMLNLSNGANSYQWQFGDGASSSVTNPIHVFSNNSWQEDTIFRVILTGQSTYGCSDADTLDVRVLPKPVAQIQADVESGCTPLVSNIFNQSLGADINFWEFGDGDTLTNNANSIQHIYENPQPNTVNYQLKLNISNHFGCSDMVQSTIEVFPKVTARFICDSAGCSPLALNFVNQSSGAEVYFWEFDSNGSSTEEHPSVIFENFSDINDTSTIWLIASSNYGCSDTATRNIVVYATPQAVFEALPNQQNFPNTTFIISNQSTYGNWNWAWQFGDGQTSDVFQPNSHTYSTWGTYNISLSVYNDYCEDSTMHSVKILAPNPTADFDFSPKNGCVPLKVSFENLSLNAENYHWDFGDGFESDAFEPTHYYYDAGTYYVQFNVAGENGSDEITLGPIEVYPSPEAHLEVAPMTVYIPDQPIKCFNLSIDEDSVLWLFGDGTQSNLDNPIHYYNEEGLYTITLIAMTEKMCMDTISTDQQVEAKSQGKIDLPNAFKPSGTGPSDGRYPTPDTDNQVFHPVFRGVSEYELNIFNRWGELIFISNDINIGWDGYYRGEICKQDVYVWKVEGKYINGKTFSLAGDVTLLR
ncbi:MAG: PKD domain-containing protein [Bacteroidales bacterium]|nr:PKD domain-containing protein [Bacteroidales bacterium]